MCNMNAFFYKLYITVFFMCKDGVIKNCSCVFFATGLNTGNNEQDNLNFNNASTSAQRPAPVYNIEYNIVNGKLGFCIFC